MGLEAIEVIALGSGVDVLGLLATVIGFDA
jgi:hypothetical protein